MAHPGGQTGDSAGRHPPGSEAVGSPEQRQGTVGSPGQWEAEAVGTARHGWKRICCVDTTAGRREGPEQVVGA